MPKTLVLCSGGLKSAFLASLAFREDRESPVLVFFDYDQKNVEGELRAVSRLAIYFDTVSHVVKQPETVLPRMDLLRVTDFILRAVPVARLLGCYRIYFGWSRDDWSRIKEIATRDIMSDFLVHLKNFMYYIQSAYSSDGIYRGKVEVDMPLYLLTEAHVIRLGNEYSTPWHHTWCCEKNFTFHCGNCLSCCRRQGAFAMEGTEDPTEYRNYDLMESKNNNGKSE